MPTPVASSATRTEGTFRGRIGNDKSASLPDWAHSREREGGRLVGVATQRKPQSGADLLHTRHSKVSNALAQALLRHGYRVVKIYRARALHAVLFVQPHFGWHSSDAGRDRSDRRGGHIPKGAVAGKYYDWPRFVRRSKAVKPNIAPSYSSGQIASASHPDNSPDSPGTAS